MFSELFGADEEGEDDEGWNLGSLGLFNEEGEDFFGGSGEIGRDEDDEQIGERERRRKKVK